MAWTKTSKNGYIILSESGLVLDDNESASAEVVTVTSAFPDGMNCSATTTNYSIECDATDVWAPYARIALNTAATDLTDGAGRCTISVAFKATNVPLEAADLANGVGADPS